jgi:hypothetical protein
MSSLVRTSSCLSTGTSSGGLAWLLGDRGPEYFAWIEEDKARPHIVLRGAAPVAVGSGQPLFGRLGAAQYLNLVEGKSFACEVVVHIYTPQRGPATDWAPAGDTAKEG